MTATPDLTDDAPDVQPLKRLRWVGYAEGTTLLLLVFVAVPLKYLGGWPTGTSIMGPVHGATFILYVVTLIEVANSSLLNRPEILRTFGACLIPFGPFLNDAFLKKKLAAATGS